MMPKNTQVTRSLLILIPLIVAAMALAHSAIAPGAHANVFTKILREAGEGSGKGVRHGVDLPGGAARFVSKLPQKPGHVSLAAHATAEGHWKFVNATGEVFTAATPEEMARVVKTLAPEGTPPNAKLSLYLTEETVFGRATHLDDLPKGASRYIVVGTESFPVQSVRSAAGTERIARLRPNIVAPLNNRKAFDEIVWQLSRPLRKAEIRVLALEPGGPASLAPAPRFDKVTRQAMVDVVDPDALSSALDGVRGQTVLVSGEIKDAALYFSPAGGARRSIDLKQVKDAARNSDVNLIIMQSRTARQPGGRNWFWQTVEVGGLKDALKRATFSDFLDAVGSASATKFRVTSTPQGKSRVIVEALPVPPDVTIPYADVVGNWVGDIASNVTGNVVTTALQAHLRDKDRQSELDNRIIPGIPSIIQMFYVGSLIFGLIAWSVSREVWAMIWPPEKRADYSSAWGYNAARFVKTLAFIFVFLPIAGGPMLALMFALQIWTVLGWIWALLTSPLRLWRWLRNSSA